MKFTHFEFDPENDRLGEGPQSEVFRAVDTRLGRTVALKILRPHIEFDPQATERFEREAKHTSNLAHPNIATIYEYGQDRSTSYIAMEYLEGRTLDKIVKDRALGYEEGVRIALQVTSALALVHKRGLIHRDLKPANIMVLEDGSVKLLDFGICRSTGESKITQDGMLVGTVLYMSPEQVRGEDLDIRTDVFALGSVFYHAFTGKLPFPGRTFPEVCMAILDGEVRAPSAVRSGFPKQLEEVVSRCLERSPEDRYANGGEVYGAYLAVAESLRVGVSGDRPTPLRGQLLIGPLDIGVEAGETEYFANGLRKDLASELQRSTELTVALLDNGELPASDDSTFVMRGDLKIEGQEGRLSFSLEQPREGGSATALFQESITHRDNDEWGLQAQLVGSLARSITRKLTEFSLNPVDERKREPKKAIALAHRSHEVLHRGTSRHLMRAIGGFRMAIEADPGCYLAHAGMGEALVRKYLYWDGDRTFLKEAQESARRALALNGSCAEAHTALGFSHAMTGHLEDALREYKLAIQLDHGEWLSHRLAGALLARQGNFKEASPLLRRAIALRPTCIAAYDHLYGVLCRLDRYQEAIELADHGISTARHHLTRAADDQDARLHLALILARMGLTGEAKEELARARKFAPKDGYTAFHVACVHALLGEAEEALEMLKEAQSRRYHIKSELMANSDLDLLRGRPEFRQLAE